jgi:hypothetical protein
MPKLKSSATRKRGNEDHGNMLQQKWENRCLYSKVQSNTMYNVQKSSPCTPPPQVDCQILGRRHVSVRWCWLDVTPMKPIQFMQWWQHPAELNVAHPYMMATLPTIQWQINPPSDTVRVQWPEWQQPQHTSKIMIHPRPESDTKFQYIKYFTSLPIVVLKSTAVQSML